MGAKRLKSRFETEVHLGLMVIIFLLLLLNLLSNFVIFKARSSHRQEALMQMQRAALAISRVYQDTYPSRPDQRVIQPLLERYKLTALDMVPSRPKDNSGKERINWLASVIKLFPPSHYPDLADKLSRADLDDVTRGEKNEYFYLYPIPAGSGSDLLILTAERPLLAYLEDSRQLLMIVQVGSLLFVGLIYLLLSRFIFKPFRQIRRKAELAGRPMQEGADDGREIVSEYEKLINQLKRNEAELLELNQAISSRAHSLEEFNRFLLNSSQLGVATLDREAKVATLSQTAADLLGINREAIEGQSCELLLRAVPGLKGQIKKAIKDGEGLPYHEYDCGLESSETRTLGISGTQLRDVDGIGIGTVLFIHDVSELNLLRRRLEDHKRLAALGEMAAGLAHQIRNSLGAIGGFGTLLKRRLLKANMEADPAEQLLDESKQAELLVKRFLNFARPLELSTEPTDLLALIRETVRQSQSKHDGSAVEIEVEGKTHTVEIDPIMMKQAMGNIIDNGIEAYLGTSGRIVIRIVLQDTNLSIEIQDFASGITPEDQEKIFTPFFSSRPDGTGLGLSLAAKILDRHGGSLTVNSEPGQGSTFVLSLPQTVPSVESDVPVSINSLP